MSLTTLNSAISGLKAAQRALDVTANNVANASTVGFTRKTLPQQTSIIGGSAVGVQTLAIARNVNKALLADLMKQHGIMQASSVKHEYLTRISDFHGASEANRSLSARISHLRESFAMLSSTPDSAPLLNSVLASAQQTARTFNEFSTLISDLRNKAQTDISIAVNEVNNALNTIAAINRQITGIAASGNGVADLEDQRDLALRTVAKYLNVRSFVDENHKMTVMTASGRNLATDSVDELIFHPTPQGPSSYYPGGGSSPLYINSADGLIDITADNVGGGIGALLELRDKTLPQYQAQIDEMAQKLAERFDSQGLRLFTNSVGDVPPSATPPATVSYTGFAAEIRVNQLIVLDPSLLQRGTSGNAVLPGSNEVLKKVLDFTFGDYSMMRATGTADISAGTLWASLGISETARVTGDIDLNDIVPTLDAHPDIPTGAQFTIQIGAGAPAVITINAGDTPTDLVNSINAALGAGTASINGLGQLMLRGNGDITIGDVSLGVAGIEALGFDFGVTNAQNPSFTVQVGSQSPVTIAIGAGDTAATLLASLNSIDGLNAYLGPGGVLIMEPEEGGNLTLVDGTGAPAAALGLTVLGVAHNPFRSTNMGAAGTIDTGLPATTKLENFAQNIITQQANEASIAKTNSLNDEQYYNTLEQRNSDQTGVDIDEEMSNMIRLQTAYTAAARMIAAAEKMFDELMQAFAY